MYLQNQRIWLRGTLKIIYLQPPCCGQWYLPLDQVAQTSSNLFQFLTIFIVQKGTYLCSFFSPPWKADLYLTHVACPITFTMAITCSFFSALKILLEKC